MFGLLKFFIPDLMSYGDPMPPKRTIEEWETEEELTMRPGEAVEHHPRISPLGELYMLSQEARPMVTPTRPESLMPN